MNGKRKCLVPITPSEISLNKRSLKKLPKRVVSIKWNVAGVDSSKPIVVFFEDEGRFGRISREMRCWVRKDMVPSVPRQMVREYIYTYSALSAQTGDCFSMISPYCNTECMNTFLHQLSNHYSDYRIVLLLDKAGWHTSRAIDLPKNLLLMHLSPYLQN